MTGQDEHLQRQLAVHAERMLKGVNPMQEYERKLSEARGMGALPSQSSTKNNPYDTPRSPSSPDEDERQAAAGMYKGTKQSDDGEDERDDEEDGADQQDDEEGDDQADQSGDGSHMADIGRLASKLICNPQLSTASKRAKLTNLLKLLDDDKAEAGANGKPGMGDTLDK